MSPERYERVRTGDAPDAADCRVLLWRART